MQNNGTFYAITKSIDATGPDGDGVGGFTLPLDLMSERYLNSTVNLRNGQPIAGGRGMALRVSSDVLLYGSSEQVSS